MPDLNGMPKFASLEFNRTHMSAFMCVQVCVLRHHHTTQLKKNCTMQLNYLITLTRHEYKRKAEFSLKTLGWQLDAYAHIKKVFGWAHISLSYVRAQALTHSVSFSLHNRLWATLVPFSCSIIPLTIAGKRNAAVLPLPVLAMPMRLCLSKATGQAIDWMAVGTVKPLFLICDCKQCE